MTMRTPLYETHIAGGARMVEFGGWDMPVQYSGGIIHEVQQVRRHVGIFDVSHMARFGLDSVVGRDHLPDLPVAGDTAAEFLDTVLSGKASNLHEWQARYLVICNENGGIIDDAIVYKIPDAEMPFAAYWDTTRCFVEPSKHWYLLVVNAGNARDDKEWLLERLETYESSVPTVADVSFEDISAQTAMIAVQGPHSVELLDSISGGDATDISRYHAGALSLGDIRVLAMRTGYTGEDGFEIICDQDSAASLWEMLVAEGAAPCGLGARDVLRLEAGLMLHGSDMTVENNPYEAGLDWTVRNDSSGYVAGDALRRFRDEGTARGIVGFEMRGRGIARPGHLIFDGDEEIGIVTSGTMSPTLGKAIGMGYVPTALAKPGIPLSIEIRGRKVDAETVARPFLPHYRRA